MASITIRRLDDALKARLRVRAAKRGRSMEEEAREILNAALRPKRAKKENLADAIRRYVEPFGGVELKIPPRTSMPVPPKFD